MISTAQAYLPCFEFLLAQRMMEMAVYWGTLSINTYPTIFSAKIGSATTRRCLVEISVEKKVALEENLPFCRRRLSLTMKKLNAQVH